jgi:RsiW-degrading membrane proteinase PrsW (M82 family)
MSWELALPLTAAGSGAAWAQLAARRAGHGGSTFSAHALLGGVAAFGLALSAFDAAALAGLEVRWDHLLRGDAVAVLAAAAIGLVEEGAKLAGILLVVDRGFRRSAILAAAAGVAAGFAALEALLILRGDASAAALARAALGPVAHALLAVPLALGVGAAFRRAGRAWWLPLAPALAVSAALHAAGDLSLALPSVGGPGYAATLVAPALVLFACARRPRDEARPSR